MDNTVFIFGAGASHGVLTDLTHSNLRVSYQDYQPPLTKDLFHPNEKYTNILLHYKELYGAREDIISELKTPSNTLESVMLKWKKYAEGNFLRLKQLVQFRFYLRQLLYPCIGYAPNGGLYTALINKVLDIQDSAEVTFVTFNYDLLIESALSHCGLYNDPFDLTALTDYIPNTLPLIKLHGSVNWVYKIDACANIYGNLGKKTSDVFERIFQISENQEPQVNELSIDNNANALATENTILYPAIAIPVEQKNAFIAPESHVELLKIRLKNAKNIVCIGWRAQEEAFWNLFSEVRSGDGNFPLQRPRLIFVGTNNHSVTETIDNVVSKYMPNASSLKYFQGFSGFLEDYDSEKLNKLLSGEIEPNA